jgi:L-asparaginase II
VYRPIAAKPSRFAVAQVKESDAMSGNQASKIDNPVLIDVTRDPADGSRVFVESFHRGAIAVVDAAGRTLVAVGDVDRHICPRSTLKPLQALAFLESGAMDEFDLGEAEAALSASSHSGEPLHVQAIAAWLKKIDCSLDQLECGAHLPFHHQSAQEILASGKTANALHNNCSGKHAGFMSLARVMGVDVAGYTSPDHPVQTRVAAILSEMLDFDVTTSRVGADGCAAPNYSMPLKVLAHGLARMARTESLVPARAGAAATLLSAVHDNPLLIAGTGRPCSVLSASLKAPGFVKSGAEGVFGAILPETGLGVAIKVDDGAARAASMILANVLDRLGVLDRGSKPVEDILAQAILNARGDRVGTIRPSEHWESVNFGV